MKAKELRTKLENELKGQLLSWQQELADLRLKQQTSDFKTVHQLRQLKKDIARAKTCLREMELAVAGGDDG